VTLLEGGPELGGIGAVHRGKFRVASWEEFILAGGFGSREREGKGLFMTKRRQDAGERNGVHSCARFERKSKEKRNCRWGLRSRGLCRDCAFGCQERKKGLSRIKGQGRACAWVGWPVPCKSVLNVLRKGGKGGKVTPIEPVNHWPLRQRTIPRGEKKHASNKKRTVPEGTLKRTQPILRSKATQKEPVSGRKSPYAKRLGALEERVPTFPFGKARLPPGAPTPRGDKRTSARRFSVHREGVLEKLEVILGKKEGFKKPFNGLI